MKYLKTYENWFSDLFKSKEYNDYDTFILDQLKEMGNYTILMDCARNGDIKKFRNYFKDHVLNSKDNEDNNVLIYVVKGKGSLKNKKEMIKTLIDEGENPFNKNINGEIFIDLIKEPELKKWVFETYPDIEMKINTDKYNL